MGRTLRRRKNKRSQNFQTCKNLILFNTWLLKKGIRRNKKLIMVVFAGCDRGLLTRDTINAGEELINLPLNLTINVSTLLMDNVFCDLFSNNSKNCLVEYKQSVTFQTLMAFYLLFLKVQGEKCKWYLYLESLPRSYTVPYFLPDEVKAHLEPSVLAVIHKQRETIDKAYTVFTDIVHSSTCVEREITELRSKFNKSDFEWAYFTVNTRCVFMDLSNLINFTSVETTVINLIKDNTNISLCPFLDMINHSADAKNESKLIVSTEVTDVAASNLRENLFSDVRFAIYTKSKFEANSQVYICYGDSFNLKLVTEYGFFVPSNNLDYVPFSFDSFICYLKSANIKLSQEQLKFIRSHRLDADLYVDSKGLSFNLYGLILVIKYFYSKDVNISKLLYSAALSSYDKDLLTIVTPFLQKKFHDIDNLTNKLKTFEQNVTLNNCIMLMNQYRKILETFINI